MVITLFIALCLGQAEGPLQEKEKGLPAEPGYSVYPMPAFASDKNSGLTWGLLGALMVTNEEGIQDRLFTIMVGHQELAGWNGELSYRYYPSPSGVLQVDAYLAAKIESTLQLYFEDSRWKDLYHTRLEFLERRTGADRFFGRGDDPPQSAESVRTSNEYLAEARFGPRLTEVWDVEGTLRWRHFRVGDSLVTDQPQMTERYPDEPGIEGGQVYAAGIRIVGDSRDSLTTPTIGTSAVVYFENATDVAPGGTHPFWKCGASQTTLWPLDEDRAFVTVLNTALQFAVGGFMPFWELPTLGGPNTLRSYNGGRFTNKYSLLVNVEERIRLLKASLFGVSGEVQVAPFFDVGKVYDSSDDLVGSGILQAYHYSTGIGFRGVVPPSFVGRLDIGFGGREGVGITIGLDYPF
jgi:outer membrane protein assembly factor BamA